jgi:sulfite reductase alpha subunit-like flavoprotein
MEANRMLTDQMLPARRALLTAIETNRQLGHENLGFLSTSYGFLPSEPPLLQLPASHRAWDELAHQLPDHIRRLTLDKTVDALPLLNADATDLPDRFLLRAACILGRLAHAYYWVTVRPRVEVPANIRQPWEQVSRRLGRKGLACSHIDTFLYNWRLIDPTGPRHVENLHLLVPVFDIQEERVFSGVMVELMMSSAPIVEAAVRAQEAVQRDDPDALKHELILIYDCVQKSLVSFAKIDQNPYSPTYVDPVLWGKTMGTLDIPTPAETGPDPSGLGSLLIHLLDAFFERPVYNSHIAQLMRFQRSWFPSHWEQFLQAIAQVSVRQYVQRVGDPMLRDLFEAAFAAYAGDSGLLGRHRLKTYGFLDVAFKAGRVSTVGGSANSLKDRVWDKVDESLETTRHERFVGLPPYSLQAQIKRVRSANRTDNLKQVVFDVSDRGIRYQPGDRVAILPENSAALVEKTLQALRAQGDEPIALSAPWRQAVALRSGDGDVATLPLRSLLRFGRIRPVDRPVAKALYHMTHNEELKRIIEARAEDQWELCDVLTMLAGAGFNPKMLWKAPPGAREYITRIVVPEFPRMYSIASAMDTPQATSARDVHLTVGHLCYATKETAVSLAAERLGTASTFLSHTVTEESPRAERVALSIVHPPRFGLPPDPRTPIVMFAGGAGLAPFRGFIQERVRQAEAGENWLFVGTRTPDEFPYQDELAQAVGQGRLHVRAAFSRADVTAGVVNHGEQARFAFEPGSRCYIGEEMLRDEHVRHLWDLIRSVQDGGQEAYFYVCGRTDFANAVMEAMKAIIRRFAVDPEDQSEALAQRVLYRLVGEGRYQQDIFTTYTGPQMDKPQVYPTSEIVCHNDEADGYWQIINGRVYDVTEFVHLHPGGGKLIRGYVGMDATSAYHIVNHHVNPEVDAMLGRYEIGVVRRLDFGAAWGVAVGPHGLHVVTLADLYKVWVRFLYAVVELENGLHNSFALQQRIRSQTDSSDAHSAYLLLQLVDIHRHVMTQYVPNLIGEDLETLWAVTAGLCKPRADRREIQSRLAALQQTDSVQHVMGLTEDLLTRLEGIVAEECSPTDPAVSTLVAACQLLEQEDKRFLRELKLALREGIQVFERFERETLTRGSDALLTVIRQIPGVLSAFYQRVYTGVQLIEANVGA